MDNFEGVTVLIRSIDASSLYSLTVSQNEEQKKTVDKYVELCAKKERLLADIKQIKNKVETENRKMTQSENELRMEKEQLKKENNKNIKELESKLYKLDENKNISLKGKDKRYYYKGNLTDSLMRRELENVLLKGDSYTGSRKCWFSDVIVNISFSKAYEVKGKKIINKKRLRDIFYNDGVWINGYQYVEFQRSSSKARTGDCLFINKKYVEHMQSWQRLGLNFKKETFKKDGSSYKKPRYVEVDITGSRSYESLTSSAIIGTVEIDPYSILLIDDVKGNYSMECNVVTSNEIEVQKGENKTTENALQVKKELYKQETDLWDGQSLIEESVFNATYTKFDKYSNKERHSFKGKGFLLLRNHFLKSAGFNTKLQDWFKSDIARKTLIHGDNEKWYAIDRFGNKMDTTKIKMVTTKNSIKIFKEPFITCILEDEIVVNQTILKEDGKSYSIDDIRAMKNEEGKWNLKAESLVWDWYRLKIKAVMGNTMGVCKFEKTSKFLEGLYQQLAYQMLNSLNLTYDDLKKLCESQIKEIMLMKNYTAFFKDSISLRERHSAKDSMVLALLEVNEMVQATKLYKDYKSEQIRKIRERMEIGKILTRDSDNCVLFGNPYEMLLASANGLKTDRTFALSSIMDNKEYDKKKQFEVYTPKYQANEELFGFRSPHICESNSALLINIYHDEYNWFNLSNNIIAVSFFGYGAFLNPKLNGCDVDSDAMLVGNDSIILEKVKLAQSKLIPINGLRQEPRTKPFTSQYLSETDSKLANDFIGRICNLAQDLQSYYWHIYNSGTEDQKQKYLERLYDDICILEVLSNVAIDSAKRDYPEVDIEKELYRIRNRDYLHEHGAIIKDDSIIFEVEENERTKEYHKRPKFMIRKLKPKKYKIPKDATQDQKDKVKRLKEKDKELIKKMYVGFDTPMDLLWDVLKNNIKSMSKSNHISPIPITEIIEPIKKGEKADYNRIERIIKKAIAFGKELNTIQESYGSNNIDGVKLYEEKQAIEKKAIEEYSAENLTTNDIVTLIKKTYEVRDRLDTNGKLIEKNGIDHRDKRLLDSKMGSRMLQWLYMAHRNDFLSAVKAGGKGTISNVVKIPKDYMISPEEDVKVFEKYGERYIIAKEVLEAQAIGDYKIYRINGRNYIIFNGDIKGWDKIS